MSATDRHAHADRVGTQRWLVVAAGVAAAVCCGSAGSVAVSQRAGSPSFGLVAGAGVGMLAVLGLPSISVRLVARVLVAFSAAVLIRFGALSGSLTDGSQAVVAWIVGAVAVFVLTDRIGTDAQPGLGEPTGPGARSGRSTSATGGRVRSGTGAGRADVARTARSTVLAAAAVLLLVLVVTPLALPRLSQATTAGDGPQLRQGEDGSAILRATDRLDMTSRPGLTDEVVFRVTTDRPTFWRGETFDRWDGRNWTRSDPDRYALDEDRVTASPDDIGRTGPVEFTQRFRIEAAYADVIYGAPSMVSVDAERPLAQRPDGTVSTAGAALGRGASYEVVSRRPLLSERVLRAAAGDVPADIAARYAAPPVITDRVRGAATSVTEDASTTYDRILALQRWMGERTEYSLDAPLSPEGVDVVDHFLFESRQGWCEQIASSLVVLARANAIPARLVTGFVPGERDPVTGTYVVRAREAHAWAEVWFPEVGWVPFDPTADVPLAATPRGQSSWGRWLIDHALVIALALGVVVALGWPLVVLVRRWRRRVAARPTTWAARADARLVGLGERVERPRVEGETATAYGWALSERYRDDRLATVGRAVDDSVFAAEPPGPEHQAEVDRILDELAATKVPAPDPVEEAEPQPVG